MSKSVSEKTWVTRVLKKYDVIEKLQPKSIDALVDDRPRWVMKLWPILLAVSHPGLNVKQSKKWTSKDLGQLLGRQCAVEGLIWNEVPLSARVEQEKQRWIDFQTSNLNSNPELKAGAVQESKAVQEWRPVFKNFIDETLASARTRPYPETSVFFEAFGKANVIKPDDLASERVMGVGERIAYIMIMYWAHISKFESIAQLHEFLSAAAKPSGIVITLKRVEKLCQRIGLKFKGRGRPKGKIQTNPPAAS